MAFITPDQRTSSTVFLGTFEDPIPDWLKSTEELKRRAKLSRYEDIWKSAKPEHRFIPRAGDVDRLVDVACSVVGIARAQIFSKNRTKPVAHARQSVYVLCSIYWPHYSACGIGRKFGADHTTVIHAWQKYHNADNKKIRRIPEETKLEFKQLVKTIDKAFRSKNK